jgi:hypothetical protein
MLKGAVFRKMVPVDDKRETHWKGDGDRGDILYST